MRLSFNFRDQGQVRLVLQPYTDRNGKTIKDQYILVKSDKDIEHPAMMLKMRDDRFDILDRDEDIDESEDSLNEKLDELAIQVIEAIQQGSDMTDVNLEEEQQPYNPEKIRVEPRNFPLKQIYDMIYSHDLELNPDFQRNLVWDDFRKSRLIESILLRIPLPMFYFSQDDEGVLFVVDGLQRLNAVKEFMDNKLVLKGLEYLSQFEGKTYSAPGMSIDDKHRRWFNMTQISVNVIDPQSPSRVKYDIFRRLNTGGRPLNAQELRNCLAYNGLRQTLKAMASLESFKIATDRSISDVRMEAQELALRFIYFKRLIDKDGRDGIHKYSGNMDDCLDDLVDIIGRRRYDDMTDYIKYYDKAMSLSFHLFGRQTFRKVHHDTLQETRRSPINKALFASISVLLSYEDETTILSIPQNSGVTLLGTAIDSDEKYMNYLSYGTNGKANIEYAFCKAYELIQMMKTHAAGN